MSTTTLPPPPASGVLLSGPRAYGRRYWVFALPAAVVVLLVILFPWLFTLFMSVHEWKVTGATPYVGFANYAKMLTDERFLSAVLRTPEHGYRVLMAIRIDTVTELAYFRNGGVLNYVLRNLARSAA